MSSEVEICNLALSNIRGGNINSLDESSLQAQQCSLKYPILRDALLRDAPWSFANKIALLGLLSTSVHNWLYTYAYPSDCLYINKCVINYEQFGGVPDGITRSRYPNELYAPDLGAQVKYQVMNVAGTKVIVSNEPNLRIDYRSAVTDPNLFDSQFILALSWAVAAELAIPIIGAELGRAMRSDAYKIYNSYLEAATASTMNESFVENVESEFITVRQ